MGERGFDADSCNVWGVTFYLFPLVSGDLEVDSYEGARARSVFFKMGGRVDGSPPDRRARGFKVVEVGFLDVDEGGIESDGIVRQRGLGFIGLVDI